MKYLIILLANCFFILYSIMFFVDHKFVPEGTSARIRNLLLLCAALYVSYNVLFIYILKKENEQSGFIYKIASSVKHLAMNSYAFIQPFQKEFIISLVIAAVIMVISFILVGMPGGLVISAMQKMGIGNVINSDNTWPAALYISFFWPLCFPIGVLTKKLFNQARICWLCIVGICLSALVWILAIVCSVFLLFANNKK